MEPRILSLHHVTATVADAQADLDFYVTLLGLRLVKRTVNFDNHFVYHFYYGTERGAPSTIMTTFPYAQWNVPQGTIGAGQVTTTSFSVPAESIYFWRRRLAAAGVSTTDDERFGDEVIRFRDPSGLALEIVAAQHDERAPWLVADIGPDAAIRGIHSVTLTVRDASPTRDFLTGVLGAEVVAEAEGRTRVVVGQQAAGHVLDIVHAPDAPAAVNGLGTVHHVALAVADGEAQRRIREDLLQGGVKVTEVRDRQYFTSIYFREPGGVLYEIATLPPGFTVDEDVARLGESLKLPPWEEPHRAAIEERLPSIEVQ